MPVAGHGEQTLETLKLDLASTPILLSALSALSAY